MILLSYSEFLALYQTRVCILFANSFSREKKPEDAVIKKQIKLLLFLNSEQDIQVSHFSNKNSGP